MARKRPGVEDLDVFDVDVGGERFVVVSLPATDAPDAALGLSDAERDVARDAASGLSNAAIAKKRNRSVRTVANQLASVYRKLSVASRAELAARLLKRR